MLPSIQRGRKTGDQGCPSQDEPLVVVRSGVTPSYMKGMGGHSGQPRGNVNLPNLRQSGTPLRNNIHFEAPSQSHTSTSYMTGTSTSSGTESYTESTTSRSASQYSRPRRYNPKAEPRQTAHQPAVYISLDEALEQQKRSLPRGRPGAWDPLAAKPRPQPALGRVGAHQQTSSSNPEPADGTQDYVPTVIPYSSINDPFRLDNNPRRSVPADSLQARNTSTGHVSQPLPHPLGTGGGLVTGERLSSRPSTESKTLVAPAIPPALSPLHASTKQLRPSTTALTRRPAGRNGQPDRSLKHVALAQISRDVIRYLQSPECGLFSRVPHTIVFSSAEVWPIIWAGRFQSAPAAVDALKALDRRGRKFANAAELTLAVQAQHHLPFKKALLTFLAYPATSPLIAGTVTPSPRVLDRLFNESSCGPSAVHFAQHLERTGEKFTSIAALIRSFKTLQMASLEYRSQVLDFLLGHELEGTGYDKVTNRLVRKEGDHEGEFVTGSSSIKEFAARLQSKAEKEQRWTNGSSDGTGNENLDRMRRSNAFNSQSNVRLHPRRVAQENKLIKRGTESEFSLRNNALSMDHVMLITKLLHRLPKGHKLFKGGVRAVREQVTPSNVDRLFEITGAGSACLTHLCALIRARRTFMHFGELISAVKELEMKDRILFYLETSTFDSNYVRTIQVTVSEVHAILGSDKGATALNSLIYFDRLGIRFRSVKEALTAIRKLYIAHRHRTFLWFLYPQPNPIYMPPKGAVHPNRSDSALSQSLALTEGSMHQRGIGTEGAVMLSVLTEESLVPTVPHIAALVEQLFEEGRAGPRTLPYLEMISQGQGGFMGRGGAMNSAGFTPERLSSSRQASRLLENNLAGGASRVLIRPFRSRVALVRVLQHVALVQKVKSWLLDLKDCQLLNRVLVPQSAITDGNVASLVAAGMAGRDTLARLLELDEQEEQFDSLKSLADAVRTRQQQLNAHINAVLVYLTTGGAGGNSVQDNLENLTVMDWEDDEGDSAQAGTGAANNAALRMSQFAAVFGAAFADELRRRTAKSGKSSSSNALVKSITSDRRVTMGQSGLAVTREQVEALMRQCGVGLSCLSHLKLLYMLITGQTRELDFDPLGKDTTGIVVVPPKPNVVSREAGQKASLGENSNGEVDPAAKANLEDPFAAFTEGPDKIVDDSAESKSQEAKASDEADSSGRSYSQQLMMRLGLRPGKKFHSFSSLVTALRSVHAVDLEYREDVLEILDSPSCSLLRKGGETKTNNGTVTSVVKRSDIDRIFQKCETRHHTVLYVRQLHKANLSFPDVESLVSAVQNLAFRARVWSYLDSPQCTLFSESNDKSVTNITLKDVDFLLRKTRAGGPSLLAHLVRLDKNSVKFRTLHDLAQRVSTDHARELEYRKQVLVYLIYPNRHNLFKVWRNKQGNNEEASNAVGVRITPQEVDAMFVACNSGVFTLQHLQKLDRDGRRFGSFSELIPAVKAAHDQYQDLRTRVLMYLLLQSDILANVEWSDEVDQASTVVDKGVDGKPKTAAVPSVDAHGLISILFTRRRGALYGVDNGQLTAARIDELLAVTESSEDTMLVLKLMQDDNEQYYSWPAFLKAAAERYKEYTSQRQCVLLELLYPRHGNLITDARLRKPETSVFSDHRQGQKSPPNSPKASARDRRLIARNGVQSQFTPAMLDQLFSEGRAGFLTLAFVRAHDRAGNRFNDFQSFVKAVKTAAAAWSPDRKRVLRYLTRPGCTLLNRDSVEPTPVGPHTALIKKKPVTWDDISLFDIDRLFAHISGNSQLPFSALSARGDSATEAGHVSSSLVLRYLVDLETKGYHYDTFDQLLAAVHEAHSAAFREKEAVLLYLTNPKDSRLFVVYPPPLMSAPVNAAEEGTRRAIKDKSSVYAPVPAISMLHVDRIFERVMPGPNCSILGYLREFTSQAKRFDSLESLVQSLCAGTGKAALKEYLQSRDCNVFSAMFWVNYRKRRAAILTTEEVLGHGSGATKADAERQARLELMKKQLGFSTVQDGDDPFGVGSLDTESSGIQRRSAAFLDDDDDPFGVNTDTADASTADTDDINYFDKLKRGKDSEKKEPAVEPTTYKWGEAKVNSDSSDLSYLEDQVALNPILTSSSDDQTQGHRLLVSPLLIDTIWDRCGGPFALIFLKELDRLAEKVDSVQELVELLSEENLRSENYQKQVYFYLTRPVNFASRYIEKGNGNDSSGSEAKSNGGTLGSQPSLNTAVSALFLDETERITSERRRLLVSKQGSLGTGLQNLPNSMNAAALHRTRTGFLNPLEVLVTKEAVRELFLRTGAHRFLLHHLCTLADKGYTHYKSVKELIDDVRTAHQQAMIDRNRLAAYLSFANKLLIMDQSGESADAQDDQDARRGKRRRKNRNSFPFTDRDLQTNKVTPAEVDELVVTLRCPVDLTLSLLDRVPRGVYTKWPDVVRVLMKSYASYLLLRQQAIHYLLFPKHNNLMYGVLTPILRSALQNNDNLVFGSDRSAGGQRSSSKGWGDILRNLKEYTSGVLTEEMINGLVSSCGLLSWPVLRVLDENGHRFDSFKALLLACEKLLSSYPLQKQRVLAFLLDTGHCQLLAPENFTMNRTGFGSKSNVLVVGSLSNMNIVQLGLPDVDRLFASVDLTGQNQDSFSRSGGARSSGGRVSGAQSDSLLLRYLEQLNKERLQFLTLDALIVGVKQRVLLVQERLRTQAARVAAVHQRVYVYLLDKSRCGMYSGAANKLTLNHVRSMYERLRKMFARSEEALESGKTESKTNTESNDTWSLSLLDLSEGEKGDAASKASRWNIEAQEDSDFDSTVMDRFGRGQGPTVISILRYMAAEVYDDTPKAADPDEWGATVGNGKRLVHQYSSSDDLLDAFYETVDNLVASQVRLYKHLNDPTKNQLYEWWKVHQRAYLQRQGLEYLEDDADDGGAATVPGSEAKKQSMGGIRLQLLSMKPWKIPDCRRIISLGPLPTTFFLIELELQEKRQYKTKEGVIRALARAHKRYNNLIVQTYEWMSNTRVCHLYRSSVPIGLKDVHRIVQFSNAGWRCLRLLKKLNAEIHTSGIVARGGKMGRQGDSGFTSLSKLITHIQQTVASEKADREKLFQFLRVRQHYECLFGRVSKKLQASRKKELHEVKEGKQHTVGYGGGLVGADGTPQDSDFDDEEDLMSRFLYRTDGVVPPELTQIAVDRFYDSCNCGTLTVAHVQSITEERLKILAEKRKIAAGIEMRRINGENGNLTTMRGMENMVSNVSTSFENSNQDNMLLAAPLPFFVSLPHLAQAVQAFHRHYMLDLDRSRTSTRVLEGIVSHDRGTIEYNTGFLSGTVNDADQKYLIESGLALSNRREFIITPISAEEKPAPQESTETEEPVVQKPGGEDSVFCTICAGHFENQASYEAHPCVRKDASGSDAKMEETENALKEHKELLSAEREKRIEAQRLLQEEARRALNAESQHGALSFFSEEEWEDPFVMTAEHLDLCKADRLRVLDYLNRKDCDILCGMHVSVDDVMRIFDGAGTGGCTYEMLQEMTRKGQQCDSIGSLVDYLAKAKIANSQQCAAVLYYIHSPLCKMFGRAEKREKARASAAYDSGDLLGSRMRKVRPIGSRDVDATWLRFFTVDDLRQLDANGEAHEHLHSVVMRLRHKYRMVTRVEKSILLDRPSVGSGALSDQIVKFKHFGSAQKDLADQVLDQWLLIEVSGRSLVSGAAESFTHPALEVYRSKDDLWVKVLSTEPFPSSLNPNFETLVVRANKLCRNEPKRPLLLKVVDTNRRGSPDEIVIGQVQSSLDQLYAAQRARARLTLRRVQAGADEGKVESTPAGSLSVANCLVYIDTTKAVASSVRSGVFMPMTRSVVRFQLAGVNLPRGSGSGRNNTYVEVYSLLLDAKGSAGQRRNPALEWNLCFRSRVVFDDDQPTWPMVVLPTKTACEDRMDQPLLIQVYRQHVSGSDRLVGSVITSVRKILTKGGAHNASLGGNNQMRTESKEDDQRSMASSVMPLSLELYDGAVVSSEFLRNCNNQEVALEARWSQAISEGGGGGGNSIVSEALPQPTQIRGAMLDNINSEFLVLSLAASELQAVANYSRSSNLNPFLVISRYRRDHWEVVDCTDVLYRTDAPRWAPLVIPTHLLIGTVGEMGTEDNEAPNLAPLKIECFHLKEHRDVNSHSSQNYDHQGNSKDTYHFIGGFATNFRQLRSIQGKKMPLVSEETADGNAGTAQGILLASDVLVTSSLDKKTRKALYQHAEMRQKRYGVGGIRVVSAALLTSFEDLAEEATRINQFARAAKVSGSTLVAGGIPQVQFDMSLLPANYQCPFTPDQLAVFRNHSFVGRALYAVYMEFLCGNGFARVLGPGPQDGGGGDLDDPEDDGFVLQDLKQDVPDQTDPQPPLPVTPKAPEGPDFEELVLGLRAQRLNVHMGVPKFVELFRCRDTWTKVVVTEVVTETTASDKTGTCSWVPLRAPVQRFLANVDDPSTPSPVLMRCWAWKKPEQPMLVGQVVVYLRDIINGQGRAVALVNKNMKAQIDGYENSGFLVFETVKVEK